MENGIGVYVQLMIATTFTMSPVKLFLDKKKRSRMMYIIMSATFDSNWLETRHMT